MTKATGKRPAGYRAPGWAFSQYTLGLIRKAGFLYDSSLQAMDEPYEIVANDEPTGLVELAIDWTLTETPYLGRGGTMPSPELLYQLYKDEFDGAYRDGTMLILTLHPHVTGHLHASEAGRLVRDLRADRAICAAEKVNEVGADMNVLHEKCSQRVRARISNHSCIRGR